MSHISYTRPPGKVFQPPHGLPLFDWRQPAAAYINPLHTIASRLSARVGVPFYVALAHAEQAGLGREGC